MRALPLVLLAACSGSPTTYDAGIDSGTDAQALEHDAGTVDAGPVDAGFMCTPGAVFCHGAQAWACSLVGNDATPIDLCVRGGVQGACSSAACDGGTEFRDVGLPGSGLYCCLP